MNVGELIDVLKKLPKEMKVVTYRDSGHIAEVGRGCIEVYKLISREENDFSYLFDAELHPDMAKKHGPPVDYLMIG